MRLVRLDPLIFERFDARDRADTWRTALHQGGWFVEPGAATGMAAVGLRELRLHLAELDAAELNINLAGHPIAWLTGGVPRSVVIAMVVVFAVVAAVGRAISEWGGLLFGLAIAPIFWGAFALGGLGVAVWHELRRRELLDLSRQQRARHARELLETVTRLSVVPWVLRTDGSVVVNAPHLTWLEHRLRDLRLAHTPAAPPERRELMERLRAALDPLEAALREANRGIVPEVATFIVDLDPLRAAFAATKVPRGVEGARLAEALERRPSPR